MPSSDEVAGQLSAFLQVPVSAIDGTLQFPGTLDFQRCDVDVRFEENGVAIISYGANGSLIERYLRGAMLTELVKLGGSFSGKIAPYCVLPWREFEKSPRFRIAKALSPFKIFLWPINIVVELALVVVFAVVHLLRKVFNALKLT